MLTAFVGQIRMAAGDIDGALTLLDDALQLPQGNGEMFYVAEIMRLTAQALLTRPNPDRSQAEHFSLRRLRSRAVRRRSSGSCAAAALARLWSGEGRQAEALPLVAPVYDWFTEGFATLELRSAKALMDELRQQRR